MLPSVKSSWEILIDRLYKSNRNFDILTLESEEYYEWHISDRLLCKKVTKLESVFKGSFNFYISFFKFVERFKNKNILEIYSRDKTLPIPVWDYRRKNGR